MGRRARMVKPEMLGEILGKILKKRNIPHCATDRRLLDTWRRAVGPQIASQTHPDTLKRGTLFVRVSAPVWLHQLQFLKEEIRTRIGELSGQDAVRNIRFLIGEIPSVPPAAAESPPLDPALPTLTGRDRAMLRQSLETIRDPELRAILERVMSREIGRRRARERRPLARQPR